MSRNIRRKTNKFIRGGLLLLAAALCTAVVHLWDENRALRSAQWTVQQIEAQIGLPAAEQAGERLADRFAPGELPQGEEMPALEIEGNLYIGLLELPTIGVSIPVMREWSYPALRLSPCRFSGSAYRDDLIVAGHNYAAHFARLHELEPGDEVVFIDVEGRRFRYTVTERQLIDPQALETLRAGDWDLTLFTCTTGGGQRVSVRCERAEE